MLVPIKTKKIYQIIMTQITDLICEKKLRPGDRLPSEREIATSLSVSRASVRQAIAALVEKGIIVVQQGDGTYIAGSPNNNDSNFILEELSMNLASEQISPTDIAIARRLIESETARLCAINIDAQNCLKLREIIRLSHDPNNSKEKFFSLNNQLHLIISECSGNRVLDILMKNLITLMDSNMWYWGKRHSENIEERRISNWKDHEELVEAICNHDAPNASLIMYNHLSSVVNEMEEIF